MQRLKLPRLPSQSPLPPGKTLRPISKGAEQLILNHTRSSSRLPTLVVRRSPRRDNTTDAFHRTPYAITTEGKLIPGDPQRSAEIDRKSFCFGARIIKRVSQARIVVLILDTAQNALARSTAWIPESGLSIPSGYPPKCRRPSSRDTDVFILPLVSRFARIPTRN